MHRPLKVPKSRPLRPASSWLATRSVKIACGRRTPSAIRVGARSGYLRQYGGGRIAEVNRYSDAKIELADPDLADLR